MKVLAALAEQITQAEFAQAVGVSEARISQLISEGVLPRDASAGEWLTAYCERLREQAAGRASAGPLDLGQERAALAREQRMGQAIKNAVARREYAPVGLLSDVLGMAASAVVDRFDQLEGVLRKAVPDLPDEAKTAVMMVIANARNEWIRGTESIVTEAIDGMLTDDANHEDDDAADTLLEADAA